MRLVNTSRLDTKQAKVRLGEVARAAGVATTGLYVQVNNGKYSRVAGRCYADACTIYRKGKPIEVKGYIKLFVFASTSLDDICHTFAHELSHLRDWRQKYYKGIKTPYGKERRARAFADKVIQKLERRDTEMLEHAEQARRNEELAGRQGLELRRLHGGGRGYFPIGSPRTPPVIGCECMACEEALELGLEPVPEIDVIGPPPPHCQHIDDATARGFRDCSVDGIVKCRKCRNGA